MLASAFVRSGADVGEHRKIADNVWQFLHRASDLHGQSQTLGFSQRMHDMMWDRLESPIEDLFWIACNVLCEASFIDLEPDPRWPYGVTINPQENIGSYRVDFMLTRVLSPKRFHGPKEFAPVVIELDGHDFHDKDKRQRSYEKARDRYLVRQGYRILHFTGSDVVADPFKVAHEALSLLDIFADEQYDPRDPVGLGR